MGGKERIGGGERGVLFLLLPAPGEANLRWQRARKLWEVWVAQLVVEVQGKQAVLGEAWDTVWVPLGGQVRRWLKIQVSWVRFAHGPRGFDGPVTVGSLRTFL